MIGFKCPGCGRDYNVPDQHAGKKAHCNQCGQVVAVPIGQVAPVPIGRAPAAPAATDPAPTRLPVRTRRLAADLLQVQRAFSRGARIHLLEAIGDPAEIYKIEYVIHGIEAIRDEHPIFRDWHVAEITMTRDYPRLAPACRMLTPIFHPNINESSICVGDHWTAGERLTDLAVRIGEMIAYQAYNVKSPLNAEAAMWADLNSDQLPTDAGNLQPPQLGQAG